MAELLVKYAENFLLLAAVIKRRLDKVVEWFGVICYSEWLTTLVAWFLEDWPYAFASKIVIVTHNVLILQPTWLWGTHLEGNTVHHRRFHCLPIFSWVIDTLLIPKQMHREKCGVPDTEFPCWGRWERQTPTFWEYPSNSMKQGRTSSSHCGCFFRKADTCHSLRDKSGLWLSERWNCFPAV